MSLKRYLARLKNLVERRLDKYLPHEEEQPAIIHKAIRYSVFSKGKRIRPILAIESCKVCGGSLKDALPLACAIELIHTYSLIHDDLPAMDNADYRRGKLTCHKLFGEANAILAGDALLALAFHIVAKEFDGKTSKEIMKELSESVGSKGLVGGQVLDLEFLSGRRKKTNYDTKLLNHISCLKTARLFEASMKTGAIAAKANPKKIKTMARFGASLGMAFQIVDDILDRNGYVKIYGLDKSRREAIRFIDKAKGSLAIFGDKANRLEEMADYILIRAK